VSGEDNRGRVLRACGGVSQPTISFLWKRAITIFEPTIAIDIGSNYGEIVFCARYPKTCIIYIVEANPLLIPYLERSRATHGDGPRMHIFWHLVSDDSRAVKFTVDQKWSGTSSAIGHIDDPNNLFKGEGPESFKEIRAMSITIDDILESQSDSQLRNLIFKIDVEGFEGRVLQGMKKTLRRADCFFGIVEFDTEFLARAGTPAEDVLAFMGSVGAVARFKPSGQLETINPLEWVDRARRQPIHCDLIVTSDQESLSKLRAPALLRPHIR
jgi:FkbM family methyltransferase